MACCSSSHIGPQNPIADVYYYDMKQRKFLYYTIMNIIYFVVVLVLQYVVADAGIIRTELYVVSFILATVFAINVYCNLHMFHQFRGMYNNSREKAINYSTPKKAEKPENTEKRYPKIEEWSSKSFKTVQKRQPSPDDDFFYDLNRFKAPKPKPSYPFESIVAEVPYFRRIINESSIIKSLLKSKVAKKETSNPSDKSSSRDTSADTSRRRRSHEATSVFNLTPVTPFFLQLSSSEPSPRLEDKDIPFPTTYPLFKRRKDKYPLSNWEEAKELLEDYKTAIRDQPVSYCFHRGQSEKYQKHLQVPIGYRDFSDMCLHLNYQMSPIADKNTMKDPYMLPINHEVWRKFKINPTSFINWIANLRIWISKTILQNLVEEIDVVNSKLKAMVPAVSIGSVGLDDLISTSQNMSISSNIPSLSILLPYLQISTNQRYVVQRLRELAEGNTMSNFSWRAGGKLDDRPWEPNLPSDAELIMHVFITYMDWWMPISLESPDRKPFSSTYFSKGSDSLPQSEIIICQRSTSPPNYELILEDEVCPLPSGAYNMFFAILLFVHYIKTQHNGTVGRMYLGESGINLLWTIED